MAEKLEDIKVEETNENWVAPIEDDGEQIPDRLSVEWSDWLMKQFHKSELLIDRENKKNAYPRVHGLRRLAQMYIGEIVSSTCNLISASPHFCAASYTVTFHKHEGGDVTYSDAADVSEHNADESFRIYPSALAVTRAEARTLRKALGLVTCSAEELGPKRNAAANNQPKTVNVDESPEYINANQITFIKVHCKKLDINPWCLLNAGVKKYKNVKEIRYDDALANIKILGDWVRDNSLMEKFLLNNKITKQPFVNNWETNPI